MPKVKVTEKEVPEGMFIMSKPMDRKSYLIGWEKHFWEKGIQTQIIQDTKNKFYLCREGVEAIGG